MTNDSPQVQALRQRYQLSLIDKSKILGDYMHSLQEAIMEDSSMDETAATVAAEIREYLHKLAGSSGMYGYEDIAQLARAAMEDVAGSVSTSNWGSIFSRLSELRNLLEQHA